MSCKRLHGVAAAAALGWSAECIAQSSNPYPITHVIMIMQENRSFDSYFGTFPGANGIPAGTCIPYDLKKPSMGCIAPFHDPHDVNAGGPHLYSSAMGDLDNGVTSSKNDGFVYEQTYASVSCRTVHDPNVIRPQCASTEAGGQRHDVVGYHTDAEIPNYWAYAQYFVLQDALFEGDRGWSLDAHLEMTSEWSAKCAKSGVLATCESSHDPRSPTGAAPAVYPWVNLFQLMDLNGVSWKYYLATGNEPDCEDGEMTCDPVPQRSAILSIWNPTPGFAWVQQQGPDYLKAHNPDADQFLLDVKNGKLPQVSWVIPSDALSEHPPSGVTAGMEYVTSLVNAVMQSPYWQNTAIFIAWDDWGGFYDHVAPPIVDYNNKHMEVQGFGIRVPGLLVSAWAKPGFIDHATLSFDSYAVLIEQLFMNGTHLDPVALGQPDNRPTIRDELTTAKLVDGSTVTLGNLLDEFDFNQTPNPTLVLSTHIPTTINVSCGSAEKGNSQACTRNDVTVKWLPVTSPEVPGPFTYNVVRDGGSQPICVTTKASCLDRAAPPGAHLYVVNSVDRKGNASPFSAATEADVP